MPTFNVADILATEVEAGEVRANIGFSETGKGVGASEGCWFGADGFIGRPNDPDDAGACMAWFFQDGNDRRVMAYRDNRFADKVGELEPGDRAIVSAGEARLLLKVGNDSITLYTESQPDEQSMMVSLNGQDGKILISCAGSWIEIDNDGIRMGAKGGKAMLTLDENGFQVDGNQCRLATKSGHLGVIAPQVAPPVGASSIVVGPSGITGVGSSSWTATP